MTPVLIDSPENSVTGWFQALRQRDQLAAEKLWGRYFDRIVRLASKHLIPDATYDEEDLAVSVFDAFFRAAQDGKLDSVSNRDELWGLLVVISRNKLIDRSRRSTAKKRNPRGLQPDAAEGGLPVDHIADDELAPDWSAAIEDECRRLLTLLEDETLKSIALLKLDGYANREIAQRLQLGERTVKRKLAIIRKTWELEIRA